jgi:hypothetical protein
MANKSAKEMTTNYTDVKVSQLNFTDLEENTRSKGQKISYPRYTSSDTGSEIPLFIQFPWINLTSYGVPKLGEYYTDDTQRSFVKIPLDQSISEVKQLTDLLREMDDKLGSTEFKEKMFGTKSSKYEYQPILRFPQEEDEDTKKDTKKDYGPRLPYMKLKIDTTFPDNQVKSIVFTSVMEGGKRVRNKVDGIKNIDDFASHICWMSRVRPIARPVKLWAQAPNKKDPTYGLTFKIAKTEVEPPSNKSNSNVKHFLESDAFLDSDEESDTVQTVAPLKQTTTKQTTTKQVTQPVTQQVKGKQVVCVDSSDEESEDEEDKPISRTASKAPVKKVESEDEDEDEEVKPISRTASKVPVKKIESEDEDDSDEEVKSKKAPTKATPLKTSSKSKKASVS